MLIGCLVDILVLVLAGGGRFGLTLTEIREVDLAPDDGCRNAAPLNLNEAVAESGGLNVARDRTAPTCGNDYGTWYQLVDATEDVVIAATCHPDTLFDASISICTSVQQY